MSARARVLFVVENDFYPQDMRVFNECTALSRTFSCYVLAPRRKGQKLTETVKSVRCYRYPSIQGSSMKSLLLEYALSWMTIGVLVPVIVVTRRIHAVHVANPPDFIVPSIAWLKLFGVRIVFDVHDISSETLRGKLTEERVWLRYLLFLLDKLESLSINAADLVIATNQSVYARIKSKGTGKRAAIVRNSNATLYRTLDEVGKPVSKEVIHIGYFGLLSNDKAAGLENIFGVARLFAARSVPFKISIVGEGTGVPRLKRLVHQAGMVDAFQFHGFIPIPEAYEVIKSFDFGLVAWGDMPKNHLHTAMKVMDYMCCAVPVCSLNLKEQIHSTGGIGIHATTFDDIVGKMIAVSAEPLQYEQLRRDTLRHFNEVLCWELQATTLLREYHALLAGRLRQGASFTKRGNNS